MIGSIGNAIFKSTGITKGEFEDLKHLKISRKDTIPLSPLPVLEETIGALLCITGKYRCFPWKGGVYTVVEGKFKTVRSREEFSNIQKVPKSTINEKKIKEDLEFESDIADEVYSQPEYETIDKTLNEKETECENPMSGISELKANSYEDLI